MKKEHSRRWIATEDRIKNVALSLMQDRSLRQVTVRAICEGAGINRSTFYDHFLDVYDMFDRMEAELSRELLDSYDAVSAPVAFSEKSFIPMLRHIRRYGDFYRVVLRTRNTFPIGYGFERLLSDVIRPLCVRRGITREDEILYCLVFFQAGFAFCLRRWLEGGCRETDEELAAILASCMPYILKA